MAIYWTILSQFYFIIAIEKRFCGSSLSDILVSTDVIATQSVENARKGKYFWKAVRGLQLMYEAFQRQLINIEKHYKEHIYPMI